MTIAHAIVVAAKLIALLMMIRYFGSSRSGQASVVIDAATNLGIELSQWSQRNLSSSPNAGATSEPRTLGVPPSEQTGSNGLSNIHWSLSHRRRPVRAHLAMLSVGSLRRTASRHRVQPGYQEPRVDRPDGPHATAQQLQHDKQFRRALELLPFAALVTNQHSHIVLANAATAKLFGYSHEELIGAPADVMIPSLQTRFHAADPSDITSARPVWAIGGTRDRFARRKDGTEFPAEITVNPIWSDGQAETLMVVMDRTDRYELLRNRQELAHLTRVSTLGELAGSLAHELNQPLTAILSNAQAAQRFMATQPINLVEVREILEDLVKDNHRASEILRKIRVLVKKGELEAAALSLASVVGDVALLVHSDAIVRGIRMYLNIAPQLPSIYGDRVQLQQVVLNLLLNAFEASEFRSAHDRVVMIEATLDSAEMVRVAVRDRGPGLARDKLDKLFMPYFTSKREGLGLGLSISRSIVEMHGGRIWAENNEGQGAAFYFTLPTGAAAERTRSRQQP